jgi:hypothetical protein
MISYSSIRISGLDLIITGTIFGFESAIALPTSELISIGNRFSSTPFSTCTMGLVGSGATLFQSESLLLDSGFFLDRVFLTLLSGWFLVELHVATLLTMLSLRSSNSTPERHFSGFSIPVE